MPSKAALNGAGRLGAEATRSRGPSGSSNITQAFDAPDLGLDQMGEPIEDLDQRRFHGDEFQDLGLLPPHDIGVAPRRDVMTDADQPHDLPAFVAARQFRRRKPLFARGFVEAASLVVERRPPGRDDLLLVREM